MFMITTVSNNDDDDDDDDDDDSKKDQRIKQIINSIVRSSGTCIFDRPIGGQTTTGVLVP